jgi:DNA-directed RNA polymerase specialized sigma24 family protein
MAQNVGRSVARQWPGVDAQDCAQEALTRLLESPDILEDYQDNEPFLKSFMRRAATRYASAERYQFTLNSFEFIYTPREVRGLLEHAYWDESIRETEVPTGPDDKTQMLVWENVCVAVWDLDAAMKRLDAADYWRLERRFHQDQEPPTEAASKAIDRAVDKVTKILNERVNRAEMGD